MKKRHLLLSLAMCLCSAASWALEPVDGVYQIGTMDDMEDFAELVLENPTANAVLTADIDLSEDPYFTIGSGEVAYAGTFDGGYHTVTINLESGLNSYCALFRNLGDCHISNLNVKGNIAAQGKYCCGLAAYVSGNAVIENCVSFVDILSAYMGDSSHSGLVGNVITGSTLAVRNCAFAGSIKGESSDRCAGMVGWADGKVTLENVMVIADFEIGPYSDGTWGNLTFGRNPGNITLKNAVYLNGLDTVEPDAVQIYEEDLASGAACFAANGMSSQNPGWFQTLGEDALPVPNPARGTVYRTGRVYCDGTPYADGVAYSNTNGESIRDEHEFEDGFCQNCQGIDPDFMTPGEDGFYNIGTAAQLCWFAAKVNTGALTINGRLTEAIDLQDAFFPTIGNKARKYAGTFDGQMKPITGITAPLFGTTDGATLMNIALESGEINGRNSDLADHNGTIVGYAVSTDITHSYSRVNITLGSEGDCGGIAGKYDYGTMKNVAYYGTCTSAGWSHAGIAGSSGHAVIADCFVLGNLVSTGGEAKGGIVGWGGQESSYSNCVYGISEGFAGVAGHQEGTDSNCAGMSAGQIEGGAATWKLNGNSFTSTVWFQDIEQDSYPVLDDTHGVVFKVSDDQYVSGMDNLKSALAESISEELDGIVACQQDIEGCQKALEALQAADDMDALAEAYQNLNNAREALAKSKAAYIDYIKMVGTLEAYLADNTLQNTAIERLTSYVEEDIEPSAEDFPNGSSIYILDHMLLTAEEIAEEIKFADSLLKDAIKSDYQSGDEVTGLLANADLTATPRFAGWTTTKEGSTLTTGTVEGIMTTAEFWNAKGDVHQTVTGLKNGIYELRAYAATRPACNIFNVNDNYIAYLYANQDEVYVKSLVDDMISENEAIDGENCHLTGNAPDQQAEIDGVTYYVPYGPVSAAYAFKGGRYLNRVLTNVTDGTLTVGLRLPGSGLANDWMGFGDFRLFYLGTADEAEGLGDAMQNYASRAEALISYEGCPDTEGGENALTYKNKPNFPSELRTQLAAAIQQAEAATTPAEKLAACARYTELFHAVDSGKAAYVELVDMALFVGQAAYTDKDITADEFALISDFIDALLVRWQEGGYTYEEAKAYGGLKELDFYKRFFNGAPELKGGVYQIASASHLAWMSKAVMSGMKDLSAEIVAPIDLAESEFQPIGVPGNAYAGTFKGNLHPITNLSCMLFGTVDGATIDGVNIQGGVVGGNTNFAAHTGAVVGFLNSGTVTRCYSSATIQGGSGDCGGMFGKVNTPVHISNCMFAGNITCGWSAGGLIGSTDGQNEEVYISDIMIDARGVTYGNGDGHGMLVGWYHDGNAARAENIWVISSPTLTDLLGYKHEDAELRKKTTFITAEQAATGMVTFGLNRGETEHPVWFQTLGTDEVPTLSSESLIVYSDGETFFNLTGKPGDVNGDGAVTIQDVVAVLEVMAADSNDPAADVNGDKAVTIQDVVAVLEIMAAQ